MRAADRAGTHGKKKCGAGIWSGWMVEEEGKKKEKRQQRLIFNVKHITDYQ